MTGPLDPWRLPIPGVAAHRGGKALGPENTVVGIIQGLSAGATHIEIDVRGTRDGAAVCMHDETAERTCQDPARIEELTLAEVRELDPCVLWSEHAGIATGDRTPPTGMASSWFKVPTLLEILSLFRGVPTILDLKSTAPVEQVVEAVEGWRSEHDVIVAGFEDDLLEQIADALPGIPVGAGQEAATAFFSGEIPEADAIMVPAEHEGIPLVDQDWIDRAHEHGMGFWVWTINELSTARELFEMGVDGIVTDDPSRMSRHRLKRLKSG